MPSQHAAPGLAQASVRELRVPGRVAVLAAVTAGFGLAFASGVGLIFYVPFALVGALLAIRRPRTSIGWLLIAVAFGFAFVTMPLALTPQQIAAHAIDPWNTFLAVMAGISGFTAFLLLAVLAVVFPSGALPDGRWGRAVRIGIAIGITDSVLVALTPEMTVTLTSQIATVRVPNPLAVLPGLPIWQVVSPDTAILPMVLLLAVAAVSLGARFRRSGGIERQQLRWLGSSLILVVLAVLLGFAMATFIPGSSEAGLAWIPAMVCYPGIPLAILIAVLRYRLYEIDTLINRAIVYGLMTAILAGVFSATIGVAERAFAGLIGPGSGASVVFTTLFVVAVFEPIKKRVQALVDRRFKEVADPETELAAFAAAVRDSFGVPDPERTLLRLAAASVAAYRARSGEVVMESAGVPPRRLTVDGAVEHGRRGSHPAAAEVTDEAAEATTASLHIRVILHGANPSFGPSGLQAALTAVAAQLPV